MTTLRKAVRTAYSFSTINWITAFFMIAFHALAIAAFFSFTWTNFFVAFALTLMNPQYMHPLYATSTGHTLIMVGLMMMAFGSLILRKLVSFKG